MEAERHEGPERKCWIDLKVKLDLNRDAEGISGQTSRIEVSFRSFEDLIRNIWRFYRDSGYDDVDRMHMDVVFSQPVGKFKNIETIRTFKKEVYNAIIVGNGIIVRVECVMYVCRYRFPCEFLIENTLGAPPQHPPQHPALPLRVQIMNYEQLVRAICRGFQNRFGVIDDRLRQKVYIIATYPVLSYKTVEFDGKPISIPTTENVSRVLTNTMFNMFQVDIIRLQAIYVAHDGSISSGESSFSSAHQSGSRDSTWLTEEDSASGGGPARWSPSSGSGRFSHASRGRQDQDQDDSYFSGEGHNSSTDRSMMDDSWDESDVSMVDDRDLRSQFIPQSAMSSLGSSVKLEGTLKRLSGTLGRLRTCYL